MTEEEINIAIAAACGKKYHKPTEEEIASGSYYQYQPNYYRSLDAMHEVEKVMTDEQCERYEAFLNDPANIPDGNTPAADYVFHSTAAQRAEAFLRTLGLWK